MDTKKIKQQLAQIKNATGTKHVKTLIFELCSVVDKLIIEVDRIQNPPTVVLRSQPNDVEANIPGFMPVVSSKDGCSPGTNNDEAK